MTYRHSRSCRAILFGSLLLGFFGLYFKAYSNVQRHLPDLSAADRAMFDQKANNNTIVLVSANSGMLHFVDNLLCSLRQTSFNGSTIVFWALDDGAQKQLTDQGYATYRDASLFGSSKNENYNGDTKTYKRMMRERPKFFIQLLRAGYDLLFLDADTVWWQSPLLIRPSDLDIAGTDLAISTDSRDFYQTHHAFKDPRRRGSLVPPVCNGIFWMKSTRENIGLWSEMLDRFSTPIPLGWFRRWNFQDDQRGMDVLLNSGRASLVRPLPDGLSSDILPRYRRKTNSIKVRLLDQTSFVNGHLLQNSLPMYEQNLARLRSAGKDRFAAHFNWKTSEKTKEEGAKELGMYFLDDRGRCIYD